MTTLQGRLFSEKLFPSPTEANPCFSAKSRCLIEMNGCFLVATEGDNLEPHQRSLFRLEAPRNEEGITFADDSQLSKDECKEKLEKLLGTLGNCAIVGVEYPLFAQGEIKERVRKFRPCVMLFGEYAVAPVYIPLYTMGAAHHNDNRNPSKFEIPLQAPKDMIPDAAADAIVDCSKVCSFPEFYNRPGTFFHRQCTSIDFLVDPNGRHTSMGNKLKAANSQILRNNIATKLVELLVDGPHKDYVDTTLKYDMGTTVEYSKTASNGEVREGSRTYDP